MAQPADPQSVLDAIMETHAEAEQISGCADGPYARLEHGQGVDHWT
jgi:hypothetical protein